MRLRCAFRVWIWMVPFLAGAQASGQGGAGVSELRLREGWGLQSSEKVIQTGEMLSSPDFVPQDWLPVTVPGTVVAAMVRGNIYPDPYFGMNLRSLPGATYPVGINFSNSAMPADSPFAKPWWYRNEFVLPASFAGRTVWLRFGGINYRADIWLNGKRLAGPEEVAGAWRTYDFNITPLALPGQQNALAVETWAPDETDLAITFVDWNPQPPDKNMGLWRGVEIRATGPVALRYPAVFSRLEGSAPVRAALTVTALLRNGTDRPVRGTLRGRIGDIRFAREVELAPGEERDAVFSPEEFKQLNMKRPRLWWPAQMGTPELYNLGLEFESDGVVSDRAETAFGIRQISSELNSDMKRVFSVNGKRILIRGGGWASDLMLREDPQRLEDEFRYVRDMGLNTIRLEGKLEIGEFFDLADRAGILVMAGWCCCDHWERWQKWTPRDRRIAEESLRSQMYRLRGHPSLLVWLNGSDNPPPPDVEKMYLEVERKCLWPNPVLSSATAKTTALTGQTGVKMTGPYQYVAPSYWLEDSTRGGAYGFNTETSPGPAVPPLESLRKMLPPDHLWPIDDWWDFHAGSGAFKDIKVFTDALNARYGEATGPDDFAMKSQLMTYEGIRAMFEAYSRNKYTSTGLIQWMLNNGWPSLIWHLYDYYLCPGGGYFGAKKAMEALHPIYSCNDRSVWVVSSRYSDASALRLQVSVLNLDLSVKFSRTVRLDAAADSASNVLSLPEIEGLSDVYFVRLRLADGHGRIAGSNFYWLSRKRETLAWDKSTWNVTPTASYADFTALRGLPEATVSAAIRTERKGLETVTRVALENTGKSLAFFLRLKLSRATGGEEILPVLWQDNYFALMPGEKREVSATFQTRDPEPVTPAVEVSGWNVRAVSVR